METILVASYMREPLIYDTEDAAVRLQMDEEVRVIEALCRQYGSFSSHVLADPPTRAFKPRCCATLVESMVAVERRWNRQFC